MHGSDFDYLFLEMIIAIWGFNVLVKRMVVHYACVTRNFYPR